jgi:hypothetical protein
VPPDPILTIHREGDHLSVQENVEPRQQLFAASVFSKADDEFLFGPQTAG